MKKEVKSEIKDILGPKKGGKLIAILMLAPDLVKLVLEILRVWKEHKEKPQPPVIMGGDDPKDPDPGSHPPAP